MVVYRKYPKKAFKDTYTPFVIKLQTLLAVLALPVTLTSVVYSKLLIVAALLYLVIMASSTTFSQKTFRIDPVIGIISPIVVLGRSIAFALGVLFSLFYKVR
jgi:hypothetical protein